MKAKIFLLIALLTACLSAKAQSEQIVEAVSPSKHAELSLQNSPKLVIGATSLTFTDNTNSTEFSKDERLVLRIKRTAKKGDVNGDGNVNINDVTTLVNIILGKSTDSTGFADVNGDKDININDITTLVNIILGK
ncbi:MAG: dockerin type I repeat-containing protein [Bacteroidaceae bacterium]|nr:dockerin type I repeat-containing protein [Bacteroidaceae bacterium]